jgi:hypothetical protein
MTAAKFRARLDRTDAIRQRGTLAIVTVGFAYAIADCAIRDPWGTLRAAYWPGVVFGSILVLHGALNIAVWALRRYS